jgi:hypothetical protein
VNLNKAIVWCEFERVRHEVKKELEGASFVTVYLAKDIGTLGI